MSNCLILHVAEDFGADRRLTVERCVGGELVLTVWSGKVRIGESIITNIADMRAIAQYILDSAALFEENAA